MTRFHTVLGLSSVLAIAGAAAMVPTISSAAPATYVACNQYGDCWQTTRMYAYGPDAPVTYYRYRSDPVDGPGYYTRDGKWHPDPAARAVEGGIAGAGVGAAIGCIVTLPIGCAPGAAVGAAVGGGTGAVAGAASTPPPRR
jgi:hypothetical protein